LKVTSLEKYHLLSKNKSKKVPPNSLFQFIDTMAVRLLFSLLVLMGTLSLSHSRLSSRGTVRVFVLAGQSNMEGHGEVATINTSTGRPLNGTLLYQLHDPRTNDEFQILWNSSDNNWNTLPNVKV
jgi:hypothetical protein